MLGYLYKLKIKNVFTVLLILSICFYIFQYIFYFLKEKPHPVIIWWTPFMGEKQRTITCSNKYTCLLTKDRNHINNTNLQAFLFYGSIFDYRDLPVPKNKIWAIFHEESPRNVALFLYQQTFDIFDITATFSQNSDLPLTFQYLENLSIITDTRYVLSLEEKNKLLSSNAPVLYIQSDCDTPVERDTYVAELMKHIDVDSFGACLNNKKLPQNVAKIHALDLFNERFLHFIAKYKFIIAFENAICEDYITEKLWRPLMVGSVPIYMGSPSVEDWLPNKNSAILTKKFNNPAQLAQYIKKVNTDNVLYESFLEHKNGIVTNERLKNALAKGRFGIATDEDHPISAFECFVCQKIHDGLDKSSSKPVYDCPKVSEGNSWEYYWRTGECQSRVLVDFVKNNVKLEDPC